MNRFALLLLFGVTTLVGCGGNGITGADSGEDRPDAEQGPDGRWQLSILEPASGAEYPVALFDVEDGETTPVEVGIGELAEGGTGITEEGFDLRVDSRNDVKLSFRGKAVGDGYRGNGVVEGQPQVMLVRLSRTDLPGLDGQQQTIPGADDLDDAQRAPDSIGLKEFIEERPSSPLVLAAHEALIATSERDAADDEEVRARISAYVERAGDWGEAYQRFAGLRAPLILASVGYAPDVVRELVEKSESELGEEERETWKPLFDEIAAKLELADAKIALGSDDEAESERARETLDAMRIEDPTRGEVTYLLANAAEKQGDDERALELFGEIVALPQLERAVWQSSLARGTDGELPSKRFETLWKKLRGEDADSDEFLDEIYEKRAFHFRGEKAPPRTEGNRTALVELFTGTQCPPCVAADLAVGAVEQDFDRDQVIALRYHQHIPQPDPFANAATETRFDYYSGRGTPTTIVDGRPVMIAGGLASAALSYETLVDAIEPDVDDETPVTIELEATPDDGKVAVKASASGIDADAKEVRFRIVVAETLVHHRAGNGIRLHEMVVRDMPAGANGVAASNGAASFETTLDLAAIKRGLEQELNDFEEARNWTLPAKPMPFEHVHVVAFVQDDATKDVLQARAVPVAGLSAAEPSAPADASDTTEKATDTETTDTGDESSAETEKPMPTKPEQTGTSEKSEPSEEMEDTETTEKAETPKAEKPERWQLMLAELRSRREFPVALVDVTDGKPTVAEVAVGEVEKVELTEKGFHLRTKDEDGDVFDFRGTAVEGGYHGNGVIEGRPQIWMVRLVRGDAESLETFEPDFIDGIDEFETAVRASESDEIVEFAEDHASSPLAVVAQEALLAATQRDESSDEEVRERAKAYVERAGEWGDRYADYARVRGPLLLARAGYAPAVARALEKSVRAELKEAALETWKPLFDETAERLELAEASVGLASEDEGERKAARATLDRLHEKDPSRGEVTYLLAEDAEKRGEKEQALALYGELLALPGMERSVWQAATARGAEIDLPSERFAALWDELEKDEAERDAFLDELYEKRAFYFAAENAGPRKAGNRVSLFELFTGTMCPPCVAADIALGGIEQVYGHDHLVALRYHQHIPGPDPFTNAATQARFDYYAGRGTPTTVLNGESMMVAGGFESAPISYEELLQALKPQLDDDTPISIALEADGNGEKLEIKASATGLDADNDGLRLRIVLAETLVHHPARNGVRLHEMVVRAMPAGVEGIAQEGGAAAFEKTLDLPAIKQRLLQDLKNIEDRSNRPFASKPMPFESVHVVAFVQDDATKEVLQARAVQVEGELVFDAEGPALESTDDPKPDEVEPENGNPETEE